MERKIKREIFIYILIVYGITYGAFVYSKFFYLNYKSVVAVSMFLPTIGALVATLIYRDNFNYIKNNLKLNRWIFVGIFLMLIIYFTSSFFQIVVYKYVLNKSALIRFPDVSDFFKNLIIGGALGSIAAVFEEIGWRGFLQSKLSFDSEIKKYLVIGILWVIFHLPQIFSGLIYKGHLVQGIIVHTCMLICFGILLCYVLKKFSSLICTSIMHGLFNALIYTSAASVILNESQVIEGAIWAVMFFITVAILMFGKLKKLSNNALEH